MFKKHKWVLGFIVATLLTLLSIGVSLSDDWVGAHVTAAHVTGTHVTGAHLTSP